jgi:hypothetical protein
MERPPGEGLENEDVQGALQQVHLRHLASPLN